MSEECKCGFDHWPLPCREERPVAKRKAHSLHRDGSARASVRLKVSDWFDLINFVIGDLANMPEDDENKQQMTRILDAIRIACTKAPNSIIQRYRVSPDQMGVRLGFGMEVPAPEVS